MLQQTRVAAVIPYYLRWLETFPTVEALARAPLDRVLSLWSGLGYYSRARNLHRGALHVVKHHGGVVPNSVEELRKIPGVGDYTAGAIASIAYGVQAPLVDGNVMRVFSRYFGLTGDITRTATRKEMWKLAGKLVPARRPGDFNQALMELGAEVCTPKSPSCGACPLARGCVARKTCQIDTLPRRAPRKKRHEKPLLHRHAVWVEKSARTLLAQRPPGGLFGGLWEMPQADSKQELESWLGGVLQFHGSRPVLRHEQELTHRQLCIDVWRARPGRGRLPASDPYLSIGWYGPAAAAGLGLSTATRSIFDAMQKRRA